jgi:hypothetical protein
LMRLHEELHNNALKTNQCVISSVVQVYHLPRYIYLGYG